jgi:hypothetical protein
MMKWIFGLLLLGNVIFFAVMQWGSALTVDNSNLPVQAPLNADKIKIVALLPSSAPVAASAVSAPSTLTLATALPAVAAVTPSVSLSCMEWGEFSGSNLQRADKLLASVKLSDKTKQRIVEYNTGYWVYISPMKSLAQVKQKVAELKEFDVDDYFVIKEPGIWKNSISLGIFKTEEAAKKYLTNLRNQGVRSAKIGERVSKLKFTVFVLNRLDSAQSTQVAALRKDFPESELKQVSCN